jgi:glutamine amidotransferase
MIGVVDYEAGNISSIVNALKAVDVRYCTSSSAEELSGCRGIILPGVGAAPGAMESLRRHRLVDFLQSYDRPFLGICLGMQVLYEYSEEGEIPCLGLIPGKVRKLAGNAEKIPHMGWNAVELRRAHPLMKGIPDGSYFYFAHSFSAPVGSATTGISRCGGEFSAVVSRGNYSGVQFHPEKSGRDGLQVLRNFSALC